MESYCFEGGNPATLEAWRYHAAPQRGAQFRYIVIGCVLTFRAVYHLPLRAIEGLILSISGLVGLDVPDYSTLLNRAGSLLVTRSMNASGPLHLVIDRTGLKVYGEGMWKVRQHGYSKRRIWLKPHLAIDPESHEIRAAMVTETGVTDAETVPDLLSQEKGLVEAVEPAAGQGGRHPLPGVEPHDAQGYAGERAGRGVRPHLELTRSAGSLCYSLRATTPARDRSDVFHLGHH